MYDAIANHIIVLSASLLDDTRRVLHMDLFNGFLY